MSNEPVEIKTHYSAAELAGLKLPDLPGSERGVSKCAQRESWACRRKTKGKGVEYAIASLPKSAQQALQKRQADALLANLPVADVAQRPLPSELKKARREQQLNLTLVSVDELSDAQRAAADARMALVCEVFNIQRVLKSKKRAAVYVAEAAKNRTLPELLQQLVDHANARSSADRVVSDRTLLRWCDKYESTDSPSERLRRLAPQVRQKDMRTPWWLGEFLAVYRRPSKPALVESYREFVKALPVNEVPPSIDAVRRMLKKLPPKMLYVGRHSGAALKAKLPFVRRDWSLLTPGDVLVGDGHGMKCKVINPETGQPMVIEVTLGLDCSSRLAMGWSTALSENVIAVSDMIRHVASKYPPPLIYYSDNGAGETGKVLDAPLTGILPRLGIHHETGIPGNPQGRGLIERAWGTITIPLAKKYPTYQGKDADRDTLRLVNRDIRRAQTVQRNAGEGMTVNLPHVPSLAEFVADLDAAINEYNQRPHSSLPKVNGVHMSPKAYYQAHRRAEDVMLDEMELRDLFRPTFTRKAMRGEVKLWNNVYFSEELMEVDGQEVQVGVDIHDGSAVSIRNMDGKFICMAEFDGNKRAGFQVPAQWFQLPLSCPACVKVSA
ncbi:Mu transposase C-terminal domain-containing protein [Chitinibacter sp. GC72]|uniref:Mu transposase C-terminal domain-containing protein n=1 Tax=Chitinibacter sp. GC72 TaxID=1526917 RepID=UPI0018DFCFDD|nr:Mu transposase C-terminal domain-containing protein [Chitinibacter sp. GC72]